MAGFALTFFNSSTFSQHLFHLNSSDSSFKLLWTILTCKNALYGQQLALQQQVPCKRDLSNWCSLVQLLVLKMLSCVSVVNRQSGCLPESKAPPVLLLIASLHS